MGQCELPLVAEEEAEAAAAEMPPSADALQLARVELGETPETREAALQEMRSFVNAGGHGLLCRQDANFLLRFLRMKKFRVSDAQKVLLKYLRMRQREPHLFHRLDCRDPAIEDLVNRGYLYVLPARDPAGRRIIVSRGSRVDPSVHTPEQVIRCNLMTFETLLEDEENQIRGFTYLYDQKGIGFSHVFMWSPSVVSHMVTSCESAMPMRHRQINFVNVHTLIHTVLEFVKGMIGEKLRKRFVIHSGLEKMTRTLPAQILPKEYGGSTPLEDMIDSWKKELLASRHRVLALDRMRASCLEVPVVTAAAAATAKKLPPAAEAPGPPRLTLCGALDAIELE